MLNNSTFKMSIMTIQSDSFSPKIPIVLRTLCRSILITNEGIPNINFEVQWLP